MISFYLHALYFNCIALKKRDAYNAAEIEKYFSAQVDAFIKKHGFENENDLITALTSASYTDVTGLLADNVFIKIFYLVNSLGEYNNQPGNKDELGRYKFDSSAQKHTGITTNLVMALVVESLKHHPFLAAAFDIVNHKSYFFLSHDIDSLYGSTLQDGLWALKNKRFDVLLKLFVNVALAKPHWFNIDTIMKLESAYDFKSTFYWLVNKGKVDQRQTNSDYHISSGKLKLAIDAVKHAGFENGLHKSISNASFKEELNKLPVRAAGNRFHYLKFQLPAAYDTIEASGLKLDASLGFAEHYGFRNNYGYPFSPYNIKTGKPYTFLEVPLNIMDGTFQRYMKIPVDKTADTVIAFFEKNKYNCLLSVLWHNTFFTNYKYKGYKEEYIKILSYLHEEKYNNINQTQILEKFLWQVK